MNLVRFCENRFQEIQMETNESKEYDAKGEAEIKAIQAILNFYRTSLKWLLVPKCLYDFIQVKLGWSLEPQPVLMNKLKEQKEKAAAEAKKHNVTPIEQAKVCEPSAPETPAG